MTRGESFEEGTAGIHSGSVLVADDDPGVRYVVRWALEGAGLIVQVAANGAEAIRAIDSSPPALIVLDLTMPLATGSEVARRAREARASTPILVVTGDGRAREKAQAVGAYDFLEKPFEVTDLVAAVQRGLQSAA